jgi:hypothetical protein
MPIDEIGSLFGNNVTPDRNDGAAREAHSVFLSGIGHGARLSSAMSF